MSYDFALEKRCPHQVTFEKADLDLANGYVFFERQPANQASVSMYVNGTLIPPFGLYSYAEVPCVRAEPYRILSGVNDLLYVGIGQSVPRFVQLLTGPNVKATDLAADLQRKLPDLLVTVVNKHLVFRSRTPYNGAAFQFPDPRWTDRTSSSPLTARSLAAFQHLGINPGRVAAGKKIVPGWDLVPDPTSPITTDRCIQFDAPLMNSRPLVLVSYSTVAGNCRRCFGSRIEFDYDIVGGTYDVVTQTDLMQQEFDKYVFTKIGSHFKWTWLGSNIMNMVGGKSNGTRTAAPALLNIDVSQAYKVYENMKQQQQQRFPFQKVSDAEMPTSLDAVNVQLLPDDPTVAVVSIVVRNRSRVLVPLRRVIGSLSPFSLTDGKGGPPFLPRG